MPSVLITGASTGIGEACVRALDQRGYRVFAGVRRAEDGERLRAATSARLTWVRLDVTNQDQITSAAASIANDVGEGGLDALVNNAGIAVGGPLEFVPMDQMREQFDVNVFGLLAVTQAMLPLLRRAPAGRIVNIGSIAGRTVTPLVGPYCASKHAVEAITDGLRLELHATGIQVSVVEPGAVTTPIWGKGTAQLGEAEASYPPIALERYGKQLALFGKLLEVNASRGVPPEAVSAAVLKALESSRPQTRYVVGTDAKVRTWLQWFLPDRVNDRLLRFVLRRVARRLA
jgi:NAD(P)-dependent dehydrogenase (short-subunit alcohol dehydrogenase family)